MATIARVVSLTLLFGLTLPLVPFAAQTVSKPAVYDYDSFGALPASEQQHLWSQLSPESLADLNRTSLLRWTVVNRARLSPEQLQLMYSFAASITADMYRRGGSTPGTDARRQAFIARAGTLFPERREWIEAFSFKPGIPPVSVESN